MMPPPQMRPQRQTVPHDVQLSAPCPQVMLQRLAPELTPELIRAARRLAVNLATDTGAEAEDLTQETLLALWGAMRGAGSKRPDNPRAYAHATLRNRAAARARALRAAPQSDIDPDTMMSEAQTPEDQRDWRHAALPLALPDVLDALDALPPDQAEVLRLRAVEGLSYADIARRMELPLGTVTSRLARGRARLAQALGLGDRARIAALMDRAKPR